MAIYKNSYTVVVTTIGGKVLTFTDLSVDGAGAAVASQLLSKCAVDAVTGGTRIIIPYSSVDYAKIAFTRDEIDAPDDETCVTDDTTTTEETTEDETTEDETSGDTDE